MTATRRRTSYRPFRLILATKRGKLEAVELMQRLRRAEVVAYLTSGRTPRGTSVIRVFVEESQYDVATNLAETGFIPPQTEEF